MCAGAYANQRLTLVADGKAHPGEAKTSNGTWETRRPAKGGFGKRGHGRIAIPPCNRKGRVETLRLQQTRLSSIPTIDLGAVVLSDIACSSLHGGPAMKGRPVTPLHGGHVALCAIAGLLDGVFGSGEDRHIASWRAIKVTDCSEEVEEDGTILRRERERFTNELTLLYALGETAILR